MIATGALPLANTQVTAIVFSIGSSIFCLQPTTLLLELQLCTRLPYFWRFHSPARTTFSLKDLQVMTDK